MRNDIKLLKLLKKEFQRGIDEGLCQTRIHLFVDNIITANENHRLNQLIKEMRPEHCLHYFYWPKGEKQSRIKAINEKIKELKRNYFKEGGLVNPEWEFIPWKRNPGEIIISNTTVLDKLYQESAQSRIFPDNKVKIEPLRLEVNESLQHAADAMTYAMQRMSLHSNEIINKFKKQTAMRTDKKQTAMRTDYELLKLLKENLKRLTPKYLNGIGLCGANENLYSRNRIALNEKERLEKLIEEMRPFAPWIENHRFYWNPKDMNIRVEAINEKIIQILKKHIKGLNWMWEMYSLSHTTGFCTHKNLYGWNSMHDELLNELKESRTTREDLSIYWWENDDQRHNAVSKLIQKKEKEITELEKEMIDVSTKEDKGATIFYDCETNSLVTEEEKSKKEEKKWVEGSLKIGDKIFKGKFSGIDTDKLEFEEVPEKNLEYYKRKMGENHGQWTSSQLLKNLPDLYYQKLLQIIAEDLCELTNKEFILYYDKQVNKIKLSRDEGNYEPYLGGVYFDTKENAEKAIEIIGQENLKKLLQ